MGDPVKDVAPEAPTVQGQDNVTSTADADADADADAAADAAADVSVGPDLPPAMKRTAEEVFQHLNSSPFFMTELVENDDVAALRALAYEGTPLESASDFKERGNEVFEQKRWVDAREFYTKGIEILYVRERMRARKAAGLDPETGEKVGVGKERTAPDSSDAAVQEEDSPDEIQSQKALLAQLYSNRAACHLSLKNHRSCWLDCGAGLRLEPTNVKALYRSSRALLAVDRADEAIDACAHGLAIDPSNGPLLAIRAEAEARREVLAQRAREVLERETRENRRGFLVRAALRNKNIRTRKTDRPPEMEDAHVKLVPDPDRLQSSTLVFPTVLFYPAHYETDFIKAFGEADTLDEHLSYVFPLPWDKGGEYTVAGVDCYVETVADGDANKPPGLIKVGRKVALAKVLGTGKVEVVDDVVKVFVVPKAKAEAWVAKHKEELAKVATKKD